MLQALVDGPRSIPDLAKAIGCCQRHTRATVMGAVVAGLVTVDAERLVALTDEGRALVG